MIRICFFCGLSGTLKNAAIPPFRIDIQQSQTRESLDGSGPEGARQSAALSILLPVVDPGDLQIHLLCSPDALRHAK